MKVYENIIIVNLYAYNVSIIFLLDKLSEFDETINLL